jgi:hypothetical protein
VLRRLIDEATRNQDLRAIIVAHLQQRRQPNGAAAAPPVNATAAA